MHAANPDLVTVVGIGPAGWSELGRTGTDAALAADVIFGSDRQLALLPSVTGERIAWPSPLLPALPGLLDAHRGRRICVLASGDPMFHGIGATLVRLLGPDRVRVVPHPSSASLAAARMGWPLAGLDVLSLVTGEVAALRRLLNPGRRVLVLSRDAHTPSAVAAEVTAAGFGAARITVLEQLGGPAERLVGGAAGQWREPPGDPLNVVAVDCGDGPAVAVVPGLPDDAYVSDGQLTKSEVRAVTLARLAPVPGALLWDVGAGSGSIGIEWMRSHPSCRAIAIESSSDRSANIRINALKLGVPALRVVEGSAPDALAGLPAPDTIFIGGGLTREGVLDACLAALRPDGGPALQRDGGPTLRPERDGGPALRPDGSRTGRPGTARGGRRLVANAVTVESEAVLAAAYAKHGGELTRLSVSRGSAVGGFTGWRTMMPVTIWTLTR